MSDAPVNAVEAVLSSRPRRGPYRRRQLIDIAVHQLEMARDLQKFMRKVIREAKKDSNAAALDAAFLREFNGLAKTITDLSKEIRGSRKDERETLGALSNEQLDDVLRIHLPRIAAGLGETDKRAIVAVWFGDEVARMLVPVRDQALEATP